MSKGKMVPAVLLGCAMAMAIAISVFGLTGMAAAGEVRITGVEFITDGQSAPNDYIKDITHGSISGSAAYPCLAAVAKIPNTATRITKLIIYFSDDHSGEPAWAQLIGMRTYVGVIATTHYAASIVQGYVGPGIEAIVIPLQRKSIEKGQEIVLGICLSAGQVFYGAKISYQ